jgi:hypothetical protein
MVRPYRVWMGVGVVLSLLFLSGCLMNMFQTARMLESGEISVVVGSGLMNVRFDDDPNWFLTPQTRVAFGLSDAANLGFQTGGMVPLTGGELGWLGARGDVKLSLIDDPESVSLAVGIGAGYGLHFVGWGVYGGIYLDANVVPVFLGYYPTLVLTDENWGVWHDAAVGLSIALSEKARLLLQIDTRNLALYSFGLGLEVGF